MKTALIVLAFAIAPYLSVSFVMFDFSFAFSDWGNRLFLLVTTTYLTCCSWMVLKVGQ